MFQGEEEDLWSNISLPNFSRSPQILLEAVLHILQKFSGLLLLSIDLMSQEYFLTLMYWDIQSCELQKKGLWPAWKYKKYFVCTNRFFESPRPYLRIFY